jgi:hypothetical protein
MKKRTEKKQKGKKTISSVYCQTNAQTARIKRSFQSAFGIFIPKTRYAM